MQRADAVRKQHCPLQWRALVKAARKIRDGPLYRLLTPRLRNFCLKRPGHTVPCISV